MDLIITLKSLKAAHNVYSFISGANDYMSNVANKDLQSAIRTLNDVADSNDYKRELSSAITQMRLSMEKFNNYKTKKFKIAALIALCYQVLSDHELSRKYAELSCKYFNDWLAIRSCCPSGKLYQQELWFDRTGDDVRELGLSWNRKCPDSGIFEVFYSNKPHQRLKAELSRAIAETEESYKKFIISLVI